MVYNNSSRQKLLLSFCFFPGSLLIHAHTCFHQSMKVIVRLFFFFLLLHLSSYHLEARRRHRELFITYKQNFCLYLVYNTGRGIQVCMCIRVEQKFIYVQNIFNLMSYLVLCIEYIQLNQQLIQKPNMQKNGKK